MKTWISTTEQSPWVSREVKPVSGNPEDRLEPTGRTLQTFYGFGAACNEMEWTVLSGLTDQERKKILSNFFGPGNGCRLKICRIPIGANDYAQNWYSCDEQAGDYSLHSFSIDRDRECIIPLIKKVQELEPELRFLASPWSPPTWMKQPPVYNYGTLKMDPETLDAYARYLEKFILAYREENIPIGRLLIQNEPFADQKFPSCVWTGEQFRIFIRDYLGPLLERDKVGTELWLGTLNGPELDLNRFLAPPTAAKNLYDTYVDTVLFDCEARRHLTGVAYQWAGKASIQRTHESFPELKLMQSESECGDGTNTWEYAFYVYNLICHYLKNGADSYVFWSMLLPPGGTSTWGWNQNSLATFDPADGSFTRNPEFYVIQHLSRFVEPGAVLLETKGHFSGGSLAFRNPDGSTVLSVSNFHNAERDFSWKGESPFTAVLPPMSLNTFVL